MLLIMSPPNYTVYFGKEFTACQSACTSLQPFLIELLSGAKISSKKSKVGNIQQVLQGLEVNNLCLKNHDSNAVGDTFKRILHGLEKQQPITVYLLRGSLPCT